MSAAPVVSELWRFPVKSFQGERVDRVVVTAQGIVGDRRYAVTDPVRGAALSAKTEPRLLEAWASTVDGEVVVRLPTGPEFAASSPDAATRLSSWLGRDLGISEVGVAPDRAPAAYWMTLDPPNDEAEQYEIPMPPATFFDLYQLHVLSTGSLQRCREARPDLEWDVRRFRPNVLVDDDRGGFPEDGWVGRQVTLGEVTIDVVMHAMRCAMPLRSQPELDGVTLARSLDIYRTLDEVHANDLGVYCSIAVTGSIAVGDAVSSPSVPPSVSG